MTQSAEYKNHGLYGVDCFTCTDYTEGKCPSCRDTQWQENDICQPVKCCRDRKIEVCGQCGEFPCDMMKEFYEESESHREAGERMKQIFNTSTK